ncbi:hypothetical protein [Paraburkholderia sp. SIMBA_053]|uniref:hypothetical protein n=1 Tax=Paraburkholderia sp. SIMBA_053 TaxID=3085794 RepID=UPI00397AA45B
MSSTVSFKIHNNTGSEVGTLDVFDAADLNTPAKITTITNIEAGSTTGAISAPVLAPGSNQARVNWSWDGTGVNGIVVENGQSFQMSSGSEF